MTTSMIEAVAAKSNPERYVIFPAARLASQRASGNGAPAATASPGAGAVVPAAVESVVSLPPHEPMMSVAARATKKRARWRILQPPD